VKKITAVSPDELEVELTVGRIQNVTVQNLDDKSGNVRVSIQEERNGKVIRKEESIHSVL